MSKSTVGRWAKDKLNHLRDYLNAYTTIMARQSWCEGYHYIDAFAGPGAHEVRALKTNDPLQQMLQGAAEYVQKDEGQKQFLAGSPRVALETNPPFSTCVFVEKSEERVEELNKLVAEFKQQKIAIRRADCTTYLREKVANNAKLNWTTNRAFVFLDPFGMQVSWETVDLLAKTRAIEILVNFPVGM